MAVSGEYVAEIQKDNSILRQKLEQETAKREFAEHERDGFIEQLGQAEARIAQLESAVPWTIYGDNLTATILRKQAEAVENFVREEGASWPTTLAKGLNAAGRQYAQRLRAQADAAEKN